MSQHDGVIDNASGATVRADINNLAAALLTRSSGTSAPSTTYANMVWVDTTLHVVKERNEGNSAWIIRHRTDAEGVLAKTALYTLAVRDFGKLIDATSGTWTLTLMAAATATDGFWFELRNSGTGVITIDGDSSETIDGLTTIEVHPGEFVRLQCNGTLWRSDRIRRLGSLPENIQTDTYTVLTSDRGKLLIANKASAMTFDLPAAATAGKGFVFFYKNIGAGVLTLDGNSTETIDGSATKSVAQNESGALECDGSNWRTLLTGGTGGGGLVLIQAQNPSGASSVDFTTGLSSTYDEYLLVGRLVPATDDVELWLRTDADGGASFDSGASNYSNGFRAVCPTATESTSNSATEIKIVGAASASNAISNAAEAGCNFWIQFSLGSASQYPIFNIKSSWGIAADTRHGSQQGGGARLSAATINAVRILAESGNVSGHVALYGIQKS